MQLESTDNAYIVNQKLKNLLNTEDEHQYLNVEKSYTLSANNCHNFKTSSNPIQINNPYLIDSTALYNIFYTPWIYYSYIIPNVEYSFDSSLSNTMCSILFWDGKNIIIDDVTSQWTYNNYKKINNILLPEKIDTFRLKIIDIKDDNEIIISRILNLYDNENNINIEINIEPDTENGLYYNYPILIFDKGR